MAREAFDLIEGDDDLNCHAELEALVHLAQQFTLDQLRAVGAEAYICTNIISDKSELARVPVTSQHDVALYSNTPLYRIPETLE